MSGRQVFPLERLLARGGSGECSRLGACAWSYNSPVPYHVRITPTDLRRRQRDIVVLDKDAAWIEEHIAGPRRRGDAIFLAGQTIAWAFVEEIHITETDQASYQLLPTIRAQRSGSMGTPMGDEWYVAREGREVTDQFLSGAPGLPSGECADESGAFATDRRAVMVIYGHDEQANSALFDWLRAIGLRPREWNQLINASGNAAPYIGQVLEQALVDVQAVVAFFTPDERVTSAITAPESPNAWRLQARPNVLVEAGMALITHPTRTVLVVLGPQELPSDIAGRHFVRLSSTSPEALQDLASRLRQAGCEVDASGTAWLNPGRFPDRSNIEPMPD